VANGLRVPKPEFRLIIGPQQSAPMSGCAVRHRRELAMSDLWFTEDHEWIRIDDDEGAVVGITDYAQDQLGELVFVELPEVGAELDQGEEGAVIELVKAAGELKIPVSGTVTEVNDSLVDEPGQVNADPLGDGWFFRIQVRDASELDGLMNEAAYHAYIESLD
jgi:glycine cleavage system H protein